MFAQGRARRALADAGRRLVRQGLVAGNEGNLSVRLSGGRLLITPAGVCKDRLRARDLVVIPPVLPEQERVGRRGRSRRRPSSETALHRALYDRFEVGAVVHAHPPFATAFAAAGRPLAPPLLAEQIMLLGPVPLLPFAPPGTLALGRQVAALEPGCRAFLLAYHGAVAVGVDLEEALLRMEILERCARITWYARHLNPVGELPEPLRSAVVPGDPHEG